jgi:light-regulated signal transduction histidine kinase (bacteriophytochrome)
MAELARGVAAELVPEYPRAQVQVGDLPPTAADPALLRQVWMNLIGNALKYSSGQSAPRVEVGGRANGEHAEYWVRDNGAGFDERYAHKLFGVFQRLHGAHEFPGTGVGLAIVQRVVLRHGGRVWAAGKRGEGARFSFALPVAGIDP